MTQDFLQMNDIVGQGRAKKILNLLAIAEKRKGRIPNLGVWGKSGMGKTALVTTWCEVNQYHMYYLNGPGIKDIMSLREFFKGAREAPDVKHLLFIDEAHCLSKKVQTSLLTMLEAPYVLTATAEKDLGLVTTPEGTKEFVEKGDILREAVPDNLSFALASTNRERLLTTIMSRLRHIELEDYSEDEMMDIASQNVDNHVVNDDIIRGLVQRSRSVRHMIEEVIATLLDIVVAYGEFDLDMLDDVLGIDPDGSNETDLAYLHYLNKVGKSGLESIAAFFQKDKDEVRNVIEPFLFSKGWITTTGAGRCLTNAGLAKIGIHEY